MTDKQQTKKQSYALFSLFGKTYRERFGRTAAGNVHRDAAMLVRIIDHIGYDESERLLTKYVSEEQDPQLTWFIFNYDEYALNVVEAEREREERRRLREATAARMKGDG